MEDIIYPPKFRQNWKKSLHETFCNVAMLAEQPVQVYIRLRPLTDEDICRNSFSLFALKENDTNALCTRSVDLNCPRDNVLFTTKHFFHAKKNETPTTFHFSGLCFAEHMGNNEVYETSIQKSIFNCTEGIHTAVFLLGLEKAGGFHTLAGSNTTPGIIFHALTDVFLMIKCYNNAKSSPFDDFGMTTLNSVRIAFINVFNNNIDSLITKKKNIQLKQDDIGSPFGRSYSIADSEWHIVTNIDEAVALASRALEQLDEERKYAEKDYDSRASIFILRVERILLETKPFSTRHSIFEETTGKFDMDTIIIKERTEGSVAFVLKHFFEAPYNLLTIFEASNPPRVLSVWDILQMLGTCPSRVKNETFESIVETQSDPLLKILYPYIVHYGQVTVLLCINPSTFYANANYQLLRFGEVLSNVSLRVRVWITGWSYQSFYCNWYTKKLHYLKERLSTFSRTRENRETLKLHFQQRLSKLLQQVIPAQCYYWNRLKLKRSNELYKAKLAVQNISKKEKNSGNKGKKPIHVEFNEERIRNTDVLRTIRKSDQDNSLTADSASNTTQCELSLSDLPLDAKESKSCAIFPRYLTYETNKYIFENTNQALKSKSQLKKLDFENYGNSSQYTDENLNTITKCQPADQEINDEVMLDNNLTKLVNLNIIDTPVKKKLSTVIPFSHPFKNDYKMYDHRGITRKSPPQKNDVEKTSTESTDNRLHNAIKKNSLENFLSSTSHFETEKHQTIGEILQKYTNDNISGLTKTDRTKDFPFTTNLPDKLSTQNSFIHPQKQTSNKWKKKLKNGRKHLKKKLQFPEESTSFQSKIYDKKGRGNQYHKHGSKLHKVHKKLIDIKPTAEHHYAPAGISYYANFKYPPAPIEVRPILVHLHRHDLDKNCRQQTIACSYDDKEDVTVGVATGVAIRKRESRNEPNSFLKKSSITDHDGTSVNIFSVEPKRSERKNKSDTYNKKPFQNTTRRRETQKQKDVLRSYHIRRIHPPLIDSKTRATNKFEYSKNDSYPSTSSLSTSNTGSLFQKTSNSIDCLSFSSSDNSTSSYTSSASMNSLNESTSVASKNTLKKEIQNTTKRCLKKRERKGVNENDLKIFLDKTLKEYFKKCNSRNHAKKRRRNVEEIIRLLYYNNHLERFQLNKSTRDLLPFIPDKYKKYFFSLIQQINQNKNKRLSLKEIKEKKTSKDESDVSSLQNSSSSLNSLETREFLDKIRREQNIGKKHRNAILRGEIGSATDRLSELLKTQEYRKLKVSRLRSLLEEDTTLVNYTDLLHQECETFKKDVDKCFDLYQNSNLKHCKSLESEPSRLLPADYCEPEPYEEKKKDKPEIMESYQTTVQNHISNSNKNTIESEVPEIRIFYAGEMYDRNQSQEQDESIGKSLLTIDMNDSEYGLDNNVKAYEAKTALIPTEKLITMEGRNQNLRHKEVLLKQNEKSSSSNQENISCFSKQSECTSMHYKTPSASSPSQLLYTGCIDKPKEKFPPKVQLPSNSFFPPPNRKKFSPDAGSPLSLNSLCFGGAEASRHRSICPSFDEKCPKNENKVIFWNSGTDKLCSTQELFVNCTDLNEFRHSTEVAENDLEWKNSLRSYLNVPWKIRAQTKLNIFMQEWNEQNSRQQSKNGLKGSNNVQSETPTSVLTNDITRPQCQSTTDLATINLNLNISRSITCSSSSDLDSVY